FDRNAARGYPEHFPESGHRFSVRKCDTTRFQTSRAETSEMTDFFSRLFRKTSPEDQFVIDVIDAMKKRGMKPDYYDHKNYSMGFAGHRMNLTNVFMEWRTSSKADRNRVIDRFLDVVAAAGQELGKFDDIAAQLRPLIRSRHLISSQLLSSQLNGAPPGNA